MTEATTSMDFHTLLGRFIHDSSQSKSRLEHLRATLQRAWGDLLKLEGTMRLFEDTEMLTRILREFEVVRIEKSQASTFSDASTQTIQRNVCFSDEKIEEATADGEQTTCEPQPTLVDALGIAQIPAEQVTGVGKSPPLLPAPKASDSSDSSGEAKVLETKSSCSASLPPTSSRVQGTSQGTQGSESSKVTGNLSKGNSGPRITTQKLRQEISATPPTTAHRRNLRKSDLVASTPLSNSQKVNVSKKRNSLHSENFRLAAEIPSTTGKNVYQTRRAPNERAVNVREYPQDQKTSKVTKLAPSASRSIIGLSAAPK